MAENVARTFENVIMTQLYPSSQIDILIQVLQGDGGAFTFLAPRLLITGTLHTAINAANLAIMDAGIAVTDYVCACSAGCVDATPILDLNNYEEASMADIPKFTLAVLPKTGKVTMVQLEARMHMSKFEAVVGMAADGARQIHATLDRVVRSTTEARIMQNQQQ
jgi:exosome complex component RRP41